MLENNIQTEKRKRGSQWQITLSLLMMTIIVGTVGFAVLMRSSVHDEPEADSISQTETVQITPTQQVMATATNVPKQIKVVPIVVRATAQADGGIPAQIDESDVTILRADARIDAASILVKLSDEKRIAAALSDKDYVTVYGKSQDQQWIYLRGHNSGLIGWVFVQFVYIPKGSADNLPIIDSPAPSSSIPVPTVESPYLNQSVDGVQAPVRMPGWIQSPGDITVRDEPLVDTDIIGQLSDGDEVTVYGLSIDQQWICVSGHESMLGGWIFVQFVDVVGGIDDLPIIYPIPDEAFNLADKTLNPSWTAIAQAHCGVPAQIQAPDDINVRIKPLVDTDIIGKLSDKDYVTVLAQSADQQWLKVRDHESHLTGWVFVQFVDMPRDTYPILPILEN